MNRPFLRALAVELGYGVHELSCHGAGCAWDWGPKGSMDSRHFRSEAEAWADLEQAMQVKFEEAGRLIRAVAVVARRDQS